MAWTRSCSTSGSPLRARISIAVSPSSCSLLHSLQAREWSSEQELGDTAIEIRALKGDPLVEQLRVQAILLLGHPLRLDVRIAERVAPLSRHADAVQAADAPKESEDQVAAAVVRAVPRLAHCGPQLYLVDVGDGREEAVRGRGLREEEELVLIAVGAAAVGPGSNRHVQALVQGKQLFLAVQRLVTDLRLLLEGRDRSLIDEGDAREDAARLHAERVCSLVRRLQPEGRGRLSRARAGSEGPHRVHGPVRKPAVRVPLNRVAQEAVAPLVLEEIRRVDLVVLVEPVDAADEAELQAVLLRRERVPSQVARADLAPDVLSVRDVGHRLEGVRRARAPAAREWVLG